METAKLTRVYRGHSFGTRWSYQLGCLGMVMGMGSLWRFPALAYDYGRGAFVICYVIMTLVLAMPLCQLEIALAQFSGSSIRALWKCLPLGRGIGMAGCYCAVMVSVYNAVIIAYVTLYLCDSVLYPELPWTVCGPGWGADAACYGLRDAQALCGRAARLPVYLMSGLVESGPDAEHLVKFPAMPVNDTVQCKNATLLSSEQFFYKRVLTMSPGVEHFGQFRLDLISYVGAVWLMVFFHLCGLAKFFTKVSLVVVPFCYVSLLLVVVRMLLLDNAVEGLRYLFAVDWKAFATPSVWHQAAQHSVFTLGVWFGPLHYLSSRNDFFEDTRWSHVFLAINAILCNVASCVMTFSALGHVTTLRGAIVTPDVDRPGQVVPFVTLPMVLGTFTLPRVASGCFFAAFFLQGLTAQLTLLSGALQQLLADMDVRLPPKKMLIVFSYCLLCFFLSCFLCTQNGFYIVHLLDGYVGGLAIPVVALYGIVAIVWIYGPHNISRDIEFLRGHEASKLSMLLWRLVCPAVLLLIVLSPLATFSGLVKMGTYQYPLWANFVGFLTVAACLGIIAVVSLTVFRKYKRDIKEAVKPHSLWGPRDPALLDAYRKHQRSWLSQRRLRVAADHNASTQKIGDLPDED